jgi:hypothetical protein
LPCDSLTVSWAFRRLANLHGSAPSAKWHIREEFPDSTPERLTGAERTLLARGGLCAASSGRSLAVPQSVPLLQSFPALRVPMTG